MINRVVDGVTGIRTGVHVCRGNWSRNDAVHLRGDYAPLTSALAAIKVQQLVLEFATPRAGDLAPVGERLNDREIGLGVASPRSDALETVEFIVGKAEKALQYYRPELIYLNPDCGFGTFSHCALASEAAAKEKMKRLVRAAQILRDRHDRRAA